MTIRIMCIYSGVPLWISPSKAVNKEDNTLISGFLSALNMFATQTVGKSLSNMTMGNLLWTFIKLHNIDDLFLVSQIEVTNQADERNYKTKIITQIISEIVDAFHKQFSNELFIDWRQDLAIFTDFQKWVDEKVALCFQIFARFDRRNTKMLAQFDRSELIFTALINQSPIMILHENPNNFSRTDEMKIIHGTFESIINHPIDQIEIYSKNHIHLTEQELS